MMAAFLCIVGGGILGAAVGYAFAEAMCSGDLDAARAELAKARTERDDADADRERWKRLANKLHNENDAQAALLAPIFRIRGN